MCPRFSVTIHFLMQATRFRLLARSLALLTIAFASCADREDAVSDPSGGAGDSSCPACAGEGSEGGSAPSSGGARNLQPTAGTGGTSAGTGSDAGTGTGGTSAGAENTPGGDGGGPPDGPLLEELSLCDRLSQVPAKNLKTTK